MVDLIQTLVSPILRSMKKEKMLLRNEDGTLMSCSTPRESISPYLTTQLTCPFHNKQTTRHT